jgi:very-short-patch-repair endonuclease
MSDNHTPVSRARNLRKNMTSEEKILWQKLRARRFHGLKFLRQHPIIYDTINNKSLYFIPDFYCAEKKLIIELDGKIHDFQKEYDERREEILKNAGFKILRFRNEEMKNVATVLKQIEEMSLPF